MPDSNVTMTARQFAELVKARDERDKLREALGRLVDAVEENAMAFAFQPDAYEALGKAYPLLNRPPPLGE